MSKAKSIFILLSMIINVVQCQNDEIIVNDSEVLLNQSVKLLKSGDVCVTVLNGGKTSGMCKSIQDCSSIWATEINYKSDPTLCGYENETKIICCPHNSLARNLECIVANTNQTGVKKFLADCPELNDADASEHINRLCTDEICSDLVCCPVKSTNRLKNVCWKVDEPSEILYRRLNLNQECTVKDLNIKGRYQPECSFAKRNPHLLSKLKNICNYYECRDWYCCPIEDDDIFKCTALSVTRTPAIFVGPKCINSKSGLSGTCKRTSDCAHDVVTLDKCGSYCCGSFYCCPDELNQTNQSTSFRECTSYTKYMSGIEIEVPMNLYRSNQTSCGDVLAAGGSHTIPGEFPHMAALGYKPDQEIFWNCGGSLISDRYVLTAGHCLTDRYVGPVKKVRLGGINLRDGSATLDCPEDFDVSKIIPHPEYKSKYVYNDIGLVELAAQVKFNFHIRPICLPSSGDLIKKYVSMGWGATGYSDGLSLDLIKVAQELFSYEECKMQYDVGRRFPNGIINDTQICAGSRYSIQSTCAGDSGGPLIGYDLSNDKLFYLYGIVSFGSACGFSNTSGVYTKVFPFVKWIEEIVWNI